MQDLYACSGYDSEVMLFSRSQIKTHVYGSAQGPRGSLLRAVTAAVLGLSTFAHATTSWGESTLRFNRDVRPVLSENCFFCHGADAENRQAGLRLDEIDEVIDDGLIVPGDPDASELVFRIEADDVDLQMPPPKSHRTLTGGQIETLRRWIAEGAKFEQHWAFHPITQPAPPTNGESPRGTIDRFLASRRSEAGLRGSPPTTPQQWLRRVSLDLTGLPPTLRELDAFEVEAAAHGDAAYAAVVDRLLASPHFGERMAIDWLDVARYADTHGFNNDSSRSMWRYRDWVIASFNRNQPYDEFLTEQLAGDLLPDPTLEQLIATAFNRNHVINSEGGIIDEEYRVEYVADRVRTVSMAWLGLTFECARCHDHKYDPISQRDYYRLFAFFNNVSELGEDGRVANAPPMISAPTADEQEKLASLEQKIAGLQHDVQCDIRKLPIDPRVIEKATSRASTARNAAPQQPVFQVDLINEEGGLAARSAKNFPRADTLSFEADSLPLTPRSSHSFAFWLNPSEDCPGETPLVSAMLYLSSEADQAYGRGVEVRLVGGEIEYRFAERMPAYAITVRTVGAKINPEEWRHVAVTFTGHHADEDADRPYARDVRVWIDGELAETRVINDGLSYLLDRLIWETYRVGASSDTRAKLFKGGLADVKAFARALSTQEIRNEFLSVALPSALAAFRADTATEPQVRLLREVAAEAGGGSLAERIEMLRQAERDRIDLIGSFSTVMVMNEKETPRQAYVLKRGRYDQPGEAVSPGVPEDLLTAWPENAPANRLGLARWLTKPDHPLTARVAVNRFWQQFFGVGLVKTSEDFGSQSEWPSHPDLLDWLAGDFVASGWDVKRLVTQLVLSEAYRQDAATSAELLKRDPENRLLARGPRIRLPAEVIRDQALAAAGLLNPRVGGPSVRPYQPAGYYNGVVVGASYPGTAWQEDSGEALYRRSLYTFWKRTALHPAMLNFDAPDREFCTVRRYATNTPLQALTLLNDPTFVEASRKLAERAIDAADDDRDRIRTVFRVVVSRLPSAGELRTLENLLASMRVDFQKSAGDSAQLISVGDSQTASAVGSAELAAWTVVASAILNLDEALHH